MRLYNIISDSGDNYLNDPDEVDFKILETDFKKRNPHWKKWTPREYLGYFTDFLIFERDFKELSAYLYFVGGH